MLFRSNTAITSSGSTIYSTVSNTNYYLTFQSATSGTSNVFVNTTVAVNTNSTLTNTLPTLSAPIISSANGFFLNSNTVYSSYNIPSGYGAMSVGPMTLPSGVVVTVPSGGRWVIL